MLCSEVRGCHVYAVNLLTFWYDWLIFAAGQHLVIEMLTVGDCGCPICH